jgi:hypothetical protein
MFFQRPDCAENEKGSGVFVLTIFSQRLADCVGTEGDSRALFVPDPFSFVVQTVGGHSNTSTQKKATDAFSFEYEQECREKDSRPLFIPFDRTPSPSSTSGSRQKKTPDPFSFVE